jgi:hypothetical protein
MLIEHPAIIALLLDRTSWFLYILSLFMLIWHYLT